MREGLRRQRDRQQQKWTAHRATRQERNRLREEVAAQQARIAEAEQERDDARCAVDELEVERDAQQAEVAQLRADVAWLLRIRRGDVQDWSAEEDEQFDAIVARAEAALKGQP